MDSRNPLAGVPSASTRRSVTGVLIRFVSCGLLCLASGFVWWAIKPPGHITIAAAMSDMLILLGGFIIGGFAWYARDVTVHRRNPERMPEERIVFSFIVFALMPLAVLAVVGLIWVIALVVGL